MRMMRSSLVCSLLLVVVVVLLFLQYLLFCVFPSTSALYYGLIVLLCSATRLQQCVERDQHAREADSGEVTYGLRASSPRSCTHMGCTRWTRNSADVTMRCRFRSTYLARANANAHGDPSIAVVAAPAVAAGNIVAIWWSWWWWWWWVGG